MDAFNSAEDLRIRQSRAILLQIAYPPSGDTLTPPDWARKQRAGRRMAGFRVWSELVPRLNVVPAQEAKPPGTLLRRHYPGAMPKPEALAIWSTGDGNILKNLKNAQAEDKSCRRGQNTGVASLIPGRTRTPGA